MNGFRIRMITLGYEDADDAYRLRPDPVFKMAGGRLPCDEDLDRLRPAFMNCTRDTGQRNSVSRVLLFE